MADALIITSPASMSAPLPGNPVLNLRGDIVTLVSDGFGGAAAPLGGRTPDAGQGGPKTPWRVEGPSDAWTTNGSGRLVAGPAATGTYFAYFQSGSSAANRDVHISIRVIALTSANTHLDLFRDSLSTSDSRKMRLSLAANGNATFSYSAPSASGENTSVPNAGFTFAAGDLLSLRYSTQDGSYTIRKNGAVAREGVFTPPRALTGTMFGIAGSAGMSTGTLDDFRLAETIL